MRGLRGLSSAELREPTHTILFSFLFLPLDCFLELIFIAYILKHFDLIMSIMIGERITKHSTQN